MNSAVYCQRKGFLKEKRGRLQGCKAKGMGLEKPQLLGSCPAQAGKDPLSPPPSSQKGQPMIKLELKDPNGRVSGSPEFLASVMHRRMYLETQINADAMKS